MDFIIILLLLVILVILLLTAPSPSYFQDTISTPNGIFEIDEDDLYIKNEMVQGRVFESDIINNIIKPHIQKSKYVVDVGANIGCHSISYGNFNPDCQIWAFEPQDKLFNILSRNVERNKMKNRVHVHKCGLGHKSMESSLNSIDKVFDENQNGYNKGGIGIGSGGESMEIKTLDSLNLPGLDFLKIDVEGAEGLVIRGGENTIRKYKPVVFFEHNYTRIDPSVVNLEYVPTPFEELMKLGYNTFKHVGASNYITLD